MILPMQSLSVTEINWPMFTQLSNVVFWHQPVIPPTARFGLNVRLVPKVSVPLFKQFWMYFVVWSLKKSPVTPPTRV